MATEGVAKVTKEGGAENTDTPDDMETDTIDEKTLAE